MIVKCPNGMWDMIVKCPDGMNEIIECPKCSSVGTFRDGSYEWEWECGNCGFLWNSEEPNYVFTYWDYKSARKVEVGRGLLVIFKEVEI